MKLRGPLREHPLKLSATSYLNTYQATVLSLGVAAHRDLLRRDEIARAFSSITPMVERARLGQIMTPSDVAAFMADLLAPRRDSRVLDPSAGLGVLAHAVLLHGEGPPPANLTLVERAPDCKSDLEGDPAFAGSRVVGTDFVRWAVEQLVAGGRWDRIIANPPYLNFHDYDRTLVTTVRSATGVKFTQFTNLFALFVVLGTRLLRPGGRAVFITPTEMFSTNYGATLLSTLPERIRLRDVIVFEPEAEPFDEADTTACITVFESSEAPGTVQVRKVLKRDRGAWVFGPTRSLEMATVLEHPKGVLSGSAPPGPALFPTCDLGSLLRASRGVATGSNDFFVLPEARKRDLDPDGRFTVPVIAKAEDLPEGLFFTREAHERLRKAGRRCWLLYLCKDQVLTPSMKRYIGTGEATGVSRRYLCGARSPWYIMETQEPPLAFVRVFGRTGLRVVLNASGARTLACCHRLYHHKRPAISPPAVVLLAAFLHSRWGQEAAAQHYRRYGGGLLKLEPSDLERISVPDVRRLSKETTEALTAQFQTELESGKTLQEACDETIFRLLTMLSLQPPLSESP